MKNNFEKRRTRIRVKVRGTADRPRLNVYKSNKFITAQIIDDEKGITLVSVTDRNFGKIGSLGKGKMARASEVGKQIAEKAKTKKIKKVVFDKSGYQYHGKIKAVADAAREGGLEF